MNTPHQIYSFGDFTLDLTSGGLLRAGREVRLRPKSFGLLKYLVENNGRLVGKEELIRAVWADTFVSDDALVKRLKDLRAALNDEGQHYIRTVPRRGYIFTAEVNEAAAATPLGVHHQQIERVHLVVDEEGDEERNGTAEDSGSSGLRLSVRTLTLVIASVALMLAAGAMLVYRQRVASVDREPLPIRSIAVLPLKNLTDDSSNDYFSDGMTESLITALSRVSHLKVIPRGAAIRFKGKEADPREVGKQLGVAAVLEGSVRKSADSVRVAVRLVSVADGRVLWARDTHERVLGDIFALQEEIARDVVAELRINLDATGAQQLARKYTLNLEAYQSYLKGRYFWNKRTKESLEKSIAYFEQAIHSDPGYALAYVALADSYLVLKSLSLVTPQAAHAKVEMALKTALEIDDTLGEAHTSLAWTRFGYEWKWSDAEREFRRAIELQPNDGTTRQWYAEYLSAMGRFDESFAEIRRAQQLEPPSPIINVIAAQIYFYARQYEQTIELCHKTLELDSSFYIAHDYLGWAYKQKGMYTAALAAVHRAKEIEDTPLQLCEIGIVDAASGNKAGARRVLQEVIEGSKRKLAPQHSYRIARIYAALQERDAAFESLEKAFNEREENLVWLKVDPHLDNLRPDPRFADLLLRVGFAPEGS